MVDPRGKCPKGSALTPPATRSSNLYRRLKRRLGCSLRRLHSKRYLVSARKQVAHKLLRTKSRVVSTKKIPTFSARKGRPDCHRQHHGCGIHQQGRRYEVRLTLCPSLAAPMLVQPQSNSTEGQTHSRPSECNCRQIVSPKAGHSDGVVPPSRDLRPPLSNLALSPSGHVCNKVQLQASSICVPNSRPKGLVSGCSDIILGGPGHVPLPPSVSDGEGGQQAVRSLVSQSNPDCPGMAQHALVLGPSGTICEGSSLSSTPPRSSDPTFQQGTSQGSDKPKSPCLAPRAQIIKEQGFSSPVASRIEAPQRRSTRTVVDPRGKCPKGSALTPPATRSSNLYRRLNKVQLQASSICVPNSRPKGLVSGCSDIILGGPGHVPLPPSVSDGEGGQQAVRSLVSQSNPDCPGMAQHALVLGPSGTICEGSSLSSTPPRSSDPTFQQGTSQGSDKPKSPCLAPRAQIIKEQGFSSPVASRIEAPQRRSTRTVYEAKWAVFVRWCETSQVDFRNPSIKQIADFLLHLFQEKNLQPSTIDGYRSAIADKLGNTSVNVGKDENLTRLLDSFHRDRPKGRRGVPAWNLSLVLHQLTKAPFEPLRKASLKHLTFKTVFLLALASGKRRSEIHAWLNKNIRHQADWSKVSLYPSPSFLAKNHLAKEGPECVAPVVIPALAPTLDKSLKEDRSLCPVRALRYYLDKTQDLRTGKELVFVSFKQGFNKDISPATISSWIKQTVVLCYDLSDQDSLTLHQVKAHDVRAFAASKAFQGGISLDQILAACHWKSHNTFTQFYLKDVAWADKELFHLGPVVAAQQIHH